MEITIQANELFDQLIKNKSRWQVCYGGAGSGKTYAIAQKVAFTLAFSKDRERWIVIRKVARTLRNSVFTIIKDIIIEMGLYEHFIIREGDLYIYSKITGNDALFLGLDDVEKLKSIREPTKIWIEEASECDQNDLMQLNLRLRGVTESTKQMILSFNPISQTHWLKGHFFDFPQKNVFISHTTYHDNAYIDDEYRAELEGLKDVDYVYYQVYCLGQWGVLGNLIFTNWTAEDFKFEAEDYDTLLFGIDYGYNHANAFVVLGMKDGELYWHDELYLKRTTNSQFIQEMEPYKEKYDLEYAEIIADSASPAYILEFQQAGYRRLRGAQKGKGSVLAGINWIKRHKIHIHEKRCPHSLTEIQGHKWKEDRDGNVIDEPVPFADDTIAAGRYAVEPLWTIDLRPDILVPIPR